MSVVVMNVTLDMLRNAIDIFLNLAYPSGDLPEAVARRTELANDRPIADLIASSPFEQHTVEAPCSGTAASLRVGSCDYPHLKLDIRPFPSSRGFIFWVDTHDEHIAIAEDSADSARWQELLAGNRRLKQEIERAWIKAKLPTFATALRESMAKTGLGFHSESSRS